MIAAPWQDVCARSVLVHGPDARPFLEVEAPHESFREWLQGMSLLE
jgi:hypothetical protein